MLPTNTDFYKHKYVRTFICKLSNPWNGSTYGTYKQIFEFNLSYVALAFSDIDFAFV